MHVVAGQAQMADPVHFSSELKTLNDQEGEIIFKAVIDAGWHVYSAFTRKKDPCCGCEGCAMKDMKQCENCKKPLNL